MSRVLVKFDSWSCELHALHFVSAAVQKEGQGAYMELRRVGREIWRRMTQWVVEAPTLGRDTQGTAPVDIPKCWHGGGTMPRRVHCCLIGMQPTEAPNACNPCFPKS